MATMASVSSTEASTATSGYHPPRPRKFAPLHPEKLKGSGDLPSLKGIIFDVDGTLCLPQNYMFKQMREALGIPKSVDILDHIRSLSDESDSADASSSSSSPRSRAVTAVQSIEREAMTSQKPQPGLTELMQYISSRNLHRGLCTRNFPAPVQHLIDNFLKPCGVSFADAEIVTRDTKGIKPKPSPEGIWSIARTWLGDGDVAELAAQGDAGSTSVDSDVLDVARRFLGNGMIMVGDSIDDMAAGYRAGAATVLLLNEDNETLADHEYTDLAIKRLDDLIEVLENGFVGKSV